MQAAAVSVRAQEDGDVSIGAVHRIDSRILGETRTIHVHLPPGYSRSHQRYPVLYLTDAETQLAHTVTTADFLARGGRIPPIIVVGVDNTDRDRDLQPLPSADSQQAKSPPPGVKAGAASGVPPGIPSAGTPAVQPGTPPGVPSVGTPAGPAGASSGVPAAGGADRFIAFFRDELIPWVEASHRTLPYRVLAGHSFGALFALHALFSNPGLFQATIAASPTFTWNDRFILHEARPFFAGHKEAGHSMFVTIGNEPELLAGFNEINRLVSRSRAAGFEGAAQRFADEDHGSVVLRSYYTGLVKVFSGWTLPSDPATGFLRASRPQIVARYRALSRRLGFDVPPPELVVNLAGYGLIETAKLEEAIDVLTLNVENYPESPNAHDSLGEALERAGRAREAKAEFARAVALAETAGHPFLPAFRDHLRRAERGGGMTPTVPRPPAPGRAG